MFDEMYMKSSSLCLHLYLKINTNELMIFEMSYEEHIGLIFACPFVEETRNCPLRDFRLKKTISKRMLDWKLMSNIELKALIDKHLICMAYREKERINFQS